MNAYQCPKCGSESLDVTVITDAFLRQGSCEWFGTDVTESQDGDQEWDENSPMKCRECFHLGYAHEFDPSDKRLYVRFKVDDVLNWHMYSGDYLAEMLIDEAEDEIETTRPGFHDEEAESDISVSHGDFVVTFTLAEQEKTDDAK